MYGLNAFLSKENVFQFFFSVSINDWHGAILQSANNLPAKMYRLYSIFLFLYRVFLRLYNFLQIIINEGASIQFGHMSSSEDDDMITMLEMISSSTDDHTGQNSLRLKNN